MAAATPFYYGSATSVTDFSPSLAGGGRYVADGEKWGGPFGTAVSLSYSFPGASVLGTTAYHANPYGEGEWTDGKGNPRWYYLTSAER
jgi:hypothetical protein